MSAGRRGDVPDLETGQERRHRLHAQIGALEKALALIGCSHPTWYSTRGDCRVCMADRVRNTAIAQCQSCGAIVCDYHRKHRTFADDKEQAKYFRLGNKISRLKLDLAQGRLL